MHCPMCGHGGIPDDACFCPVCRHQFRQPASDPIFDQYPQVIPPYHDDRPAAAESPVASESHLLDALLLQPAVLVMIIVTAVTYVSVGSLPQLTVTIMGAGVSSAGPASLLAGIIVGWVFYRFMLVRLE